MENNVSNAAYDRSLTGEAAFKACAGEIARTWREQRPTVLVVGLEGPLGAGKTTWVRGMLEGLGHQTRVPSPTYTLLEQYDLDELTIVHLDLYRLPESGAPESEKAGEFEALGVRDWLACRGTWLLVEWPERSPQLTARCDVTINFEFTAAEERGVSLLARSALGEAVLKGLQTDSS